LSSVVTGVRFREYNNGLFLDMQYGKLLPMGLVDASTVKWMEKPANDDVEYFYPGNGVDLGKNVELEYSNIVITGSNRKNIFCVLFLFLITSFLLGVKLRKYEDRLKMEAYGDSIDFIRGVLYGNEYHSGEEGANFNHNPGSYEGISSSTNNKFIVTRNHRINFRHETSSEYSGYGKVTPFFDTSEVKFDQPAPITSIQLIHYTNDVNYAGYIRPIIKSFNYTGIVGAN
jgi:hypothetical protein